MKGRIWHGVTLRDVGIDSLRGPASCTQYTVLGAFPVYTNSGNCQPEKRGEPGAMPYGEARSRPGRVDMGASAGNLLWHDRHDVGPPSFS